jgi:hypothetical protein
LLQTEIDARVGRVPPNVGTAPGTSSRTGDQRRLTGLDVVDKLNSRPRQTLKWQTPHEVFQAASVAMIA